MEKADRKKMVSLRFQRQRSTSLLPATLFLLFFTIYFYHLPRDAQIRNYLPEWPYHRENVKVDLPSWTLDAPSEYNVQPYHSSFCAERYDRTYLETMRDTATDYCIPGSFSNLTCFHTTKWPGTSRDTMCLAQSATYDFSEKKFKLGCDIRPLNEKEKTEGYPEFNSFRSYWYNTGTKVIFDDYFSKTRHLRQYPSTYNYTILIKREGALNPWHCLLEIWSTMMTMDVLRMSINPGTNAPFYVSEDVQNTQIVILDDHVDGFYIDLWAAVAKRPIIRLKELPETTEFENVIVPLPGASNPIWQGDWDIHDCGQSELLRTFSDRVLSFYNVEPWAPHDSYIVVTYIDRRNSRRLVGQESYLEELALQDPRVKIQMIDFESIPFSEQVKIVRETDILVGVHGAGLTHGIFLPEGSVMVEILPEGLSHKGFRNLAGLRSHTYLSVHASKLPAPSRGQRRAAWHAQDVTLDRERFLDLMRIAVRNIYNKGLRNFDVN
ncbi:hypothetical protein EYC80_006544 [Monilinia laxa]|uniref:EGF domain-specific O-linked N-acetylglucosamine transferase n=1 Tax=Monilinia laxa TaxID=61186 RepID=A0A5N6JS92_MONLA|nr:hypothetical protein EYC80_006544 [Monilinia laxa]